MVYLDLKSIFDKQGIFSSAQAISLFSTFDKANFGRWCKKGWLIKLRNGLYAFPEAVKVNPAFSALAANVMYKPSYVSLEYAMSMYDMIPETVLQITSVTSLKTWHNSNAIGEFSYRTIRPDLLFGWVVPEDSHGAMIATPEKALLDFLWLNNKYNTEADMLELRLDESFMRHEFSRDLALTWLERFHSHALYNRFNLLLKVYNI